MSRPGPLTVVAELSAVRELPGGARALFTAREHGNLSSRSGPGRERAAGIREALRARLGLNALLTTRQVHGAVVLAVPPGQRGALPAEQRAVAPERPLDAVADGQATAARGIGLAVFTADCLPIVLVSDSAVAVVHAGWRGLAAGVIEAGVRRLCELGAGRPAGGACAPAEGRAQAADALVALIGPGAGPCCYEVGAAVHAALATTPASHRVASARRIDLKAIAAARLRAAGVATVEDVGICTICDERCFSHRRQGAAAGRQAVIAWRA